MSDGELHRDARRTIDTAFDASEIVWERHRILVEPCRRIMDAPSDAVAFDYPTQPEMYLARMPGGEERTIDRAQLMMMAGQDPDA